MGKIIRVWFVGMFALLVSCSVEPSSIAESERVGGLPADAIPAKPGSPAENLFYPSPEAGWLDAGAKFAVVLGGSSSCPAFPSSLEVLEANHLKLGIDTRGGPNCTTDLVQRTYVIKTPNEVDVSREVTLQYGKTTVVLPPL
jgi:hypothetical protein